MELQAPMNRYQALPARRVTEDTPARYSLPVTHRFLRVRRHVL